MLLEMTIMIKTMCHFKSKYLLQNQYDNITMNYVDGFINILDFMLFVEYYESEITIKLFTVCLN
jgi:hypothetical protein